MVKTGERTRLLFSMQIPGVGAAALALRHRTRIDTLGRSTRGGRSTRSASARDAPIAERLAPGAVNADCFLQVVRRWSLTSPALRLVCVAALRVSVITFGLMTPLARDLLAWSLD